MNPAPARRRRNRSPRRVAVAVVAATAALSAPSIASACSQDNATWLESFLDETCLQTPFTNTTLDALGGLRLATNGTPVTTSWDTDAQLTSGVTFETIPFGRVGVSTLAVNGTGAGASLGLPATLLPLSPATNSALSPATSTVPDGDHVDSPSVIKTGATSYVMYYVGLAEDGAAPVILRATSTNGKSWTRAASPNTPVLAGSPGAFDEKGVSGPHVIYDAGNAAAPYRMYYSGQGAVFGGIGYATSTDGMTWVKHTGTASPADPPVPVVEHGRGGSADSFSAGDPWVMKEGVTYKMWYTADDSNQKRIAYATSVDGVVWQKGGAVVNPGSPAIMKDDAFAPTVWKDGTTYRMMFGGFNASGSQTKLVNATSSDGISWSGFGTGLPTSGSATKFDNSNLNSPGLLDEGVAGSERYKLYYAGNTVDAYGNAHYRIGLATSGNGSSFSKYTPGGNDSVLDIAAFGTDFDARSASGLSVALTGGSGANAYVGFYSGIRGSDAVSRIGVATSTDGVSWAKVPVVTTGGNGGALFNLDPAGNTDTALDNAGAESPAVLLDGSTYNLYYTGVDVAGSSGKKRIFRISTSQDGTTKQPVHGSWTTPSAAAFDGDGSGFDADGVSHPSVIKDGTNYVVHYTGHSGASPEIGRASSASADLSSPTRAASPVVAKGASGEFDANGAKDPVVVKISASDYRMLYTGIDAAGVERLGYATSMDGSTWTKEGVVLNPSLTGFASDEVGVGGAGMLLDNLSEASATKLQVYTTMRDRSGRARGGYATTDYPTPVSAASGIPAGWATYQLGDDTTSARDWRSITRTSTGTGVGLWLSFLQPYTIAGTPAWSDFFPVTELSATETLNLLLTVKGVRWQARLSGPAGNPALDTVAIEHAPVQFHTSGSAVTKKVEPASNLVLTAWGNLTVKSETFGGGTVGGTVSVRNADTDAELIPAITLNTGGETTQSLAAINAAQNRRLKLVFNLASSGAGTPKLRSTTVSYSAVELTGPVALLSATPTSGNAPLAVNLDGSASMVPGGRTITAYNWDFDGNGTVDQTTATPTTMNTYLGGTWPAKLTITDSTGAVSPPASVTVTAADPTAPTGVAITGPVSLSKPFQLFKPLPLTWSATDAESAIRSYALYYREAPIGGAFGAPVFAFGSTTTGTSFALKAGSTYCFKVTATNGVGLATTSPERCTALPLHSYGLTAKGTWAKKSKAGHYLGRYRTAKAKGATLLRSGVTVKRLSIVATRGKGMGTVSVWIGTTKLKTIRLAATTTRKRQVIAVANFTKVRKGTVKVVVESSGKPVIIEGLAVSKM